MNSVNSDVDRGMLSRILRGKTLSGINEFLKSSLTYAKTRTDFSNRLNESDFFELEKLPFGENTNKIQKNYISRTIISLKESDHIFRDVAGLHSAKQILKRKFIIPILYPEICISFGVKKPNGILFYGPPGCGKTMLARCIASGLGTSFFYLKGI